MLCHVARLGLAFLLLSLHTGCIEKSEDNFYELALSFHCGTGPQTWPSHQFPYPFYKDLFNFVCMNAASMYVCMPCAYRTPQIPEDSIAHPELELQVVLSQRMGAGN